MIEFSAIGRIPAGGSRKTGNGGKVTILEPNLISDVIYKGKDIEGNEEFFFLSVTYSVSESLVLTMGSSRIRTIQVFVACMLHFRVPSVIRSFPSNRRYEYNVIHFLHDLIT